MAYYFFLDEMMLPVPPEKMTVQVQSRNKTIELINEGEINIIRDAGLTEIEFDIRLPGSYRPYADFNSSFGDTSMNFVMSRLVGQTQANSLSYQSAENYLQKIRELKTSKEPFQFVVTRDTKFSTNLTVTLEEYSIEEDAEDGFDVTVPVRLKQYRDYATKEVSVSKDANGKETVTVKQNRKVTKPIAKQVQVAREKSMWEICQKATGGRADWRDVMKLNNLSNPNAVPAKGTVLNLNTGKSSISGSISGTLKGL